MDRVNRNGCRIQDAFLLRFNYSALYMIILGSSTFNCNRDSNFNLNIAIFLDPYTTRVPVYFVLVRSLLTSCRECKMFRVTCNIFFPLDIIVSEVA